MVYKNNTRALPFKARQDMRYTPEYKPTDYITVSEKDFADITKLYRFKKDKMNRYFCDKTASFVGYVAKSPLSDTDSYRLLKDFIRVEGFRTRLPIFLRIIKEGESFSDTLEAIKQDTAIKKAYVSQARDRFWYKLWEVDDNA